VLEFKAYGFKQRVLWCSNPVPAMTVCTLKFGFLNLLIPTFSATAPALLYLLHPCSRPAGEGAKVLNFDAR
jgi:hypothetical protein